MKFALFALFLIFSSCQEDRIRLSLSEISFSTAPMASLSTAEIQDISEDPAVRFQWKKALVKRILEEKVEKVNTSVDRRASDLFMGLAESELTQPNGIEISGVVFFIPKKQQEKLSETERADLGKKADALALQFHQALLIDPSDEGLRELFQDTKKNLPTGLKLSLKFETKILARSEVVTPGWLFLAPVLDSHQHSNIDNVAPPVKVGKNIFVTILRERINAETLSVDVIRKRADELALAETRKVAVVNFFAIAAKDAKLELFPDVIQKDGTVE